MDGSAVAEASGLCALTQEVSCNSVFFNIRCSIVVSISARHAEDPGSIPGGGVGFLATTWDMLASASAEPW